MREQRQRTVRVEVGELPRERTAARGSQVGQPAARLGFRVQSLTPELAQQLGTERAEGVVTEVDPRSEAYQAGVRPGMVIQEVNQQAAKNVQDFQQAVEQAEQGKQILLLVQSPQATMYLTFPVG